MSLFLKIIYRIHSIIVLFLCKVSYNVKCNNFSDSSKNTISFHNNNLTLLLLVAILRH